MICPACGLSEGSCECLETEGGVFLPLAESTDVVLFSEVTSRLEKRGIAWFVQCEQSPAGLPWSAAAAGAGGQVAMIYVAAERFEEARALVGELGPVGALVRD